MCLYAMFLNIIYHMTVIKIVRLDCIIFHTSPTKKRVFGPVSAQQPYNFIQQVHNTKEVRGGGSKSVSNIYTGLDVQYTDFLSNPNKVYTPIPK